VTHAVEIDHLDSVYLVPPGHPEPQQVRWQLDRVARTRLDAALGRALAEVFDADEDLVCVIDELEVDIALDVDGDEDALAAAWAQAIAAAIRAAVDDPPAGNGVRVFASGTDLLAAFLADMAAGRAWERGCYAAFDGLRVLPSQATIREALGRDPETARAALVQLASEQRLEPVLRALGGREAERVAAALAAGGTATPAAVEAVLDVWPEVRGGRPERGRPPDAADALRLAALAAGEADPASVVAAALALVAIEAAHSAGEEVRAEALLQELARHDLRLAEEVEEAVSPAAARAAPGAFVGTAYAGVFLLLQGLLDLDADRVLAALAPEEPSVAPLRLALLARCLGTPDAAADPGVRIAAGGEEELEAEPVGDGWGPAQRLLLERLVRLGRADGRRLLLERVEGGELVLVRDAERDAWLALLDAETAEAQAVRIVTELFEREPEAVEWSAEPCDLDGPPGTLALLARAVLRELAVRLPGLDRSSPAYLRENFLVGPGMIHVDAEVVEVQLPPSPLRIVLQLAGVHGRPLAVPWLGEVVLRLPDP
jgi:hypothetical protein